MAMYQLRRIVVDYENTLILANTGFDYYYKVLDKFSNCKNILFNQKKYVDKLRKILNYWK